MSKTNTLSLLKTCKISVPSLLNHLSFPELELHLFSLLVETPQLVKLLSKHKKEMNQLISKTNLPLLLTKSVILVLDAPSLLSAQWLSELP
jgi:hypothetical protein